MRTRLWRPGMADNRDRSARAKTTELVVSITASVVFVVLAIVAFTVQANGLLTGCMIALAAVAAWRSVARLRSLSESR